MSYDPSKNGYVWLKDFCMWVTNEWAAGFEKAYGRAPETKAEIDAFSVLFNAQRKRDEPIRKAAAVIAEKAAKKPVLKFPEAAKAKGFKPPTGSRMPGFQVPKRYT